MLTHIHTHTYISVYINILSFPVMHAFEGSKASIICAASKLLTSMHENHASVKAARVYGRNHVHVGLCVQAVD